MAAKSAITSKVHTVGRCLFNAELTCYALKPYLSGCISMRERKDSLHSPEYCLWTKYRNWAEYEATYTERAKEVEKLQ